MWATLLVLTITIIVAKSVNHCPASSVIKPNSDYHAYPLEIYKLQSSWQIESQHLRNCTEQFGNKITNFQCSDVTRDVFPCPIHKHNVEIASGVANWSHNVSPFCDLLYSDGDINLPVNIFFVGGSMTVGSATEQKCCCQHSVDSRCHLNTSTCATYPRGGKYRQDWYCSWTGFYTRWLRDQFPQQHFIIKNLAVSGGGSDWSVNNLLSELPKGHNISNRDIFLIDHSVNDAASSRAGKPLNLRMNFEALIRRIYQHALVTSPAIVIIEQWPHVSLQHPNKPTGTSVNDYARVYREVAEHYGILLWSYREALWSPTTAQKNLFEHLKSYGTHPPWHVHLLFADLLAAVTLDQCTRSPQNSNSNSNSGSGSDSDRGSGSGTNSSLLLALPPPLYDLLLALPPPLYDLATLEAQICNVNVPPIASLEATSTYKPSNLAAFERQGGGVGVGWRDYIDHHRPGFIITDHVYDAINNNKSDQPETNTNANTSLILPLSLSTHTPSSLESLMIKITYLRTYQNAGTVNVQLCGQRLGIYPRFSTIDALWDNHETYHYSLPQTVMWDIPRDMITVCERLPVDQQVVDVKYTSTSQSETPIIHLNKHKQDEAIARGHQKVKLFDVVVCQFDPF